jgi:conjugative transfer signal peptidase TraF
LSALAAPVILRPAPRLIWNASASAPMGLWRVTPGTAGESGDHVAATPPPAVRVLAARRGYLPANVPLIKVVAAGDGDLVCATGQLVLVNGTVVAERRKADARGRRLPWWRGCARLADGAVLLLSPSSDGFDGRYFGPIPRALVIGKATPLWLP